VLKPRWFRRRGVALILAMLTTVILVTLSLAFMSLSLSEARTSRAYSYEETSVQAASYGLEYALVYMGNGRGDGSGHNTWEVKAWPNPGGDPAFNFGFYNVLRRTEEPITVSGLRVTVSDISQDPSLASLVPANLPPAEQARMRLDLRRIRILDASDKPGLIPLGPDLGFVCDIVVDPILLERNQGRHDYRLISTARILQIPPGGVASVNQQPVATRVVEARVKESSFDYAHFVANARTWNVQGHTINSLPVQDPSLPQQPLADLSDYVMIPPRYVENGPMRVDGQAPVDPDDRSVPLSRRKVVGNAGNLRFAPGSRESARRGDLKFNHKLFINQFNNVYDDSDIDDATMAGFNGGLSPSAMRVGIPDFQTDHLIRAAKVRIEDTDVSGYIQVTNSEIPGAIGSTVRPPRQTDPVLGPFYERQMVPNEQGQLEPVVKQFDYRPRFPNVEVTLNGDRVRVVKRDTATGAEIGVPQEFSQSQLKMKLLYVEGGNVVVKTAGNADSATGKFRGRLSIVAGESPSRESMQTNPNTIYSPAARQFFDMEKARWDRDSRAGTTEALESYKTPPYTIRDLRQAKASNPDLITSEIPTDLPDTHPLWPAPEAEVNSQGEPVKYKVEREGNLGVVDDVVYDKTAGNSLGLFAQNFVFLNDSTPSLKLTIDAVMMSKERSVSLDWDNSLRQNYTNWLEMMRGKDANGEPMQRTVKIRGSVIGEYIDVEGDAQGRGYVNQEFEYDLGLRNANPPFMPRPNLAELAGGYRYMILHYLDRGSLSTAGLL
jgi:hypothetical protein